ncbi:MULTISPECIES: hypothetical protein [Lysinibacillus]|uniref:hypothetical protein n=1 Tax=Lysinibacillus TaxID=400634 RepID=UPI00258053FD|nr:MULTISPECIES: hypothetical protein [Lysinibacillus]
MSEFEKIEHITQQFIKEQLANLSNYNSDKNNSFAFLEKGTLNLLIAYLISGEKPKKQEINNDEFDKYLVKQLDEVIEESKKQFEEVMSMLGKFQ